MTKKIANVADYRIALDVYEMLYMKQLDQVGGGEIKKNLKLLPAGHLDESDDSNELLQGLLVFVLKHQADIERNAFVSIFFTQYFMNLQALTQLRDQVKRINAALTKISRKFIEVNEQQKQATPNFENQFSLAKDILYNYVLDISLPKLSWCDDLARLMKAHKCSISEISIIYDPSRLTFSISAKSTMTRYMENAQEIERLNLRVAELTQERDVAREQTKVVIKQRDDAINETNKARNETDLVKSQRDAAINQRNELSRLRDVIEGQRDTAVRDLYTARDECSAVISKINQLKEQLLTAHKLLNATAKKEKELLDIIQTLQVDNNMGSAAALR